MAASLFESPLFRDLFGDRDLGALFTDAAELRAMMIVEGALAKAQGAHGIIPEISAAAIGRASLEIQLDPGALAKSTAQDGIPVPAMVALFAKEMQAPEHAQYLHWGATSQDIMDTALMLRLRQVLAIYDSRLTALLAGIAQVADTHADLPIAARTWGQVATPTSFGAMAAAWGWPLHSAASDLTQMRKTPPPVSLSGAAGTGAVMGPLAGQVRADLAQGLGLSDPQRSWHSTREVITTFSAWATKTAAALGKFGADIIDLAALNEINFTGSGGASSTMPQKQNPVQASQLVALAGHVNALNSSVQSAAVHRGQRDGAAWMREWLALPQICLGLGRALSVADDLAQAVAPAPQPIPSHAFAEALTFTLAAHMPRPDAQTAVKAMCAQGGDLRALAQTTWPHIDLSATFDPTHQMANAPHDARAFAKAVRND